MSQIYNFDMTSKEKKRERERRGRGVGVGRERDREKTAIQRMGVREKERGRQSPTERD